MKRFAAIGGMLASVLLLANSGRAAAIANFTGGNGTDQVDQYLGKPGDGWATAWQASTATTLDLSFTSGYPTVSNSNPLTLGGGNYLQSLVSSANPPTGNSPLSVAVRRQYDGVDISQSHTISFDFRPDAGFFLQDGNPSSSANPDNRYQIYGGSAFTDSTSEFNTWVAWVGATATSSPGTNSVPKDYVAGTWGFLSGHATSQSVANQTFVNTGIAMVPGTVYHFEITVDPANRQYWAKLTDGVNSYETPSGSPLLFRTTSTGNGGDHLHFGSRQRSGTTALGFSVDNISVVPEPNSIVIAAIGLVGFSAFVRKRKILSRRQS